MQERSFIEGTLGKDEVELLRALLVVITKLTETNESDVLEDNSSEEGPILGERPIFASFNESDIESISSSYSSVQDARAKTRAKETVADMREKHAGFLRNCDDLEYELGLFVSSFLSVGGTRSVVRASTATRSFLKEVREYAQEWIPFETYRMKVQGTLLHQTLSALAEASLQLRECLIDFETYHGLLLQEFRDWEWSLRDGVINIVRLLNQRDYEGLSIFVFQSLMPELSRYMERISQKLKALVSLTLPPMQSAENNATSRYLNMTTIATFFSGVTATTLQFSYSQSGSALNDSVNLFWLLSLVFSVSSAINSLLGMTWRKSSIAPPTFRLPRWAAVWLDVAPMLFLFISAFTFAIGLAIFSFASQQSTLVSVLVTAFIVLHILGLSILSVWFLTEVEKDNVGFLRRFIHRIFYEPLHVFFSAVKQGFVNTIKSVRHYTDRRFKSLRTTSLRFRSGLTSMGSDLEAAEKTDEGQKMKTEVFEAQGAGDLQPAVEVSGKDSPEVP